MTFRKTLTAICITALFSTSSFADPLTVYGKANVSVQSADEGETRVTEVKSNSSRFGIKGNVELDNNLEAIYVFEWQVDLSDESGADNIKSRNQYVGLKGNFGSIVLGRNDTVLKQSQGKIDQFSDYEADVKGLWKGENRMSDSITYISPIMNGFSIGASYVAGEDDGQDAQSVSLIYGDMSLKKSQWFASLAADFDMKGYDTQRASVQAKFDKLVLGAIVHNQEPSQGGESKSGAMLSAAYTLGKVVVKSQYQTLEDDDSFTIGADYKLGKSTKAFVWYTHRGLETSEDKSWAALGLEHKF